ncbi:MAG: SCO family protein [Methylophilaceae bacterium]|nr:SCO family protein [Methylophilaceae bacterium]
MFAPIFRLSHYLLLAFTLCLLVGCDGSQTAKGFVGTDITGADFPKPLALTDHTGTPRTMSDFKGKLVVMFFGFTHCPDVCPTSMLDLKNSMKLLGDKANEVQVLFVTVDPERDTQEVLAKFVPAFDERFIGLRGNAEETAATLKNFKVYYAKVPNMRSNDYTIDHSAGMYMFDKLGKVRVYLGYGQKPEDIASDIQKLL